MKMPQAPPRMADLNQVILGNPARLPFILALASQPAGSEPYLHWDDLRHRRPPAGLTHQEWWYATKLGRTRAREVPLRDRHGEPFRYSMPDPIPESLHHVDRGAGGRLRVPDPIMNPDTRDQYHVASLLEEAITSSQIEGANTTRRAAKEMIQRNRSPRNRSEQMILNNFHTMQLLSGWKEEDLTPDLIREIHRLVTDQTLDDKGASGRFRRSDEDIVVSDAYGQVFHRPPESGELDERAEAMCAFANDHGSRPFLHPVARSIFLHFWLAYDHPFVDGNGRVARALFYWSMLRHGFWLMEYVSISTVIRKSLAQYSRSFLLTETDDNDLTYFLLYQLDVIERSLAGLHRYIERKSREVRESERRLKGMADLNHRQRALIVHALRHPATDYTIEGHRTSHDVVYQTARADLRDLQARGLMSMKKVGKRFYFTPAPDLQRRLARGGRDE